MVTSWTLSWSMIRTFPTNLRKERDTGRWCGLTHHTLRTSRPTLAGSSWKLSRRPFIRTTLSTRFVIEILWKFRTEQCQTWKLNYPSIITTFWEQRKPQTQNLHVTAKIKQPARSLDDVRYLELFIQQRLQGKTQERSNSTQVWRIELLKKDGTLTKLLLKIQTCEQKQDWQLIFGNWKMTGSPTLLSGILLTGARPSTLWLTPAGCACLRSSTSSTIRRQRRSIIGQNYSPSASTNKNISWHNQKRKFAKC